MTNLTRRTILLGCVAIATASPLSAASQKMTPRQAHEAAEAGQVVLLDIRTRSEWQQTGIGRSAHPVSMHEPDFLVRLNQLTAGDRARPVALICAVGNRSRAVQEALAGMGYSRIIDVPEGMIGGAHGPGWIKAGLPLKPYPKP